jgi:NADH-quinone oxidoreductase subunit L
MALSVSVAGAGCFLAYLMYRKEVLSPDIFANLAGGGIYRLFNNKWYLDEIYQVLFVNGTLLLANILSVFDKYVVDGIVNGSATLVRFLSWLNGLFDQYVIDGIVNAVADITFWIGNKLRRVQTGSINSYLYGILIAIAIAVIVKYRYWS